MAEIVPVTSEALEAQVRNLLPSQRGFGQDLQASNVITPIIDLTPAAEGTTVPAYQQQAIAFGSQTAFNITNTTTVIINTPGFYRVFGVGSVRSTTNANNIFQMSDGLSTKTIWTQVANGNSTVQFDFIVFLRAGDSLSGITNTTTSFLIGSTRQVADVNGNPVNPVGFTPQ